MSPSARVSTLLAALALILGSCSPSAPNGAPSPTAEADAPSASPTASVSPSPSDASPPPSPPATGPAQPIDVPRGACGSAEGTLRSFHTFIDPSLRDRTSASGFAADIRAILCDERSWIAAGTVRWRYRDGDGVLVRLLPPDEAERRCMELIGLSVARRYSCAHTHEVVINSDRWYTGAPYAWGPVARYRRMLINHELGHIVRQRHQVCERDGAPAPVMMQQSKTLTTGENTCRANAWPLPEELERLRTT